MAKKKFVPPIPDDSELVFEKDGRIYYPFIKKDYKAKREEYVRALWVVKLIREYQYDKEQIDLEVKIPSGQTETKKPADIVIFKNHKITTPTSNAHIIVEIKNPDRTDGLTQMHTYLSNTTAELGVWSNGEDTIFQQQLREPHNFIDIPDIPRKRERIEDIGSYYKKDLVPASDLKTIFENIHNHIFVNEGLLKEKIFTEILKLIFCKMVDEMDSDPKCKFRITKKEYEEINDGLDNDFSERIEGIFRRVKNEYEDVYDQNDKIIFKKISTLSYVVSLLQKYSLRRTSADVKGIAFQTFVYAHQRGERGEFFTPHPIVDLAVRFLNPKDDEYLIDPAAGSGGFLIASLRHVWNKYYINRPDLTRNEIKDQIIRYVRTYVYGDDFNPDLAKVCKMHMILYDDGHTNIYSHDSLDTFDVIESKSNNKIKYGKFNVLLTNPPFGSKGRVKEKRILEQFELGHKWNYNKRTSTWTLDKRHLVKGQVPDILFLERCIELLDDYGRMAIVLPDGNLTNPSLGYVREFIDSKARILASISLPFETFMPHGTNVKSSVVFLQKIPRDELIKLKEEDYKIFAGVIEKIGYDVRGKELFYRDLNGDLVKESVEELDLDTGNKYKKYQFKIDSNMDEMVEEFEKFKLEQKLGF